MDAKMDMTGAFKSNRDEQRNKVLPIDSSLNDNKFSVPKKADAEMDMTGAVKKEQSEQKDEVFPVETNSHDHANDSMDFTQDAGNPMSVLSEQDSPSHILLALVGVRFQSQAKAAFASKYKELRLDYVECDQDQMENILCQFGSSIESLSVRSNYGGTDGILFRSIIQNCSAELKELQLYDFKIQIDSLNFRFPFTKLQELCLIGCTGNVSMAQLVDDCPALIDIDVSCCNLPGVNEMIDRKFQKLERLGLWSNDGQIQNHALENFMKLNPALLSLRIADYVVPSLITSNVIRLIGENMLELRTLELTLTFDYQQQSDFKYIGNLHKLEKLELYCSISNGKIDKNAIKHISQLKQITILSIYNLNGFDECVIYLLRNLPKLERMSLHEILVEIPNDTITIDGLMQMLDCATNLRTLHLGFSDNNDGFTLTINTHEYKIMVDQIRNRPEKSSLDILIYDDKIKLNIDETILQQNCKILSIKYK